MTDAERIAKTFVDTRAALAESLGWEVDSWAELSDFGKTAHIRVFEVMLQYAQIAVPKVVTQRDIFANPDEVAKDVREIDALIAGLHAMYAKAHDDVLSSISVSDMFASAGSRGGGSDPTGSQVANERSEHKRHGVRKVATQIREARNLLYMARRSLRDFTTTTTIQPEKLDTKALISQEDFDRARRNAQERAS